MKVVILAGGLGTRLAEYTDVIPKPMVEVGGQPLIWHIMQLYGSAGFKDFCLALGYKGHVIKKYFLDYRRLGSDVKIDMASGKTEVLHKADCDWLVNLVDTGNETMTGGRIKRLSHLVQDGTFFLTYGDGVCDVDLNELLEFHKSHGKMITMTAVRPAARFGELKMDGDRVQSFVEKPQLHDGWINGGFFVVEPEFLHLIEGDETFLEREPLTKALNIGELMAYKHDGFWQCMDTKRDKDLLEKLWLEGAPWIRPKSKGS